MLICGYRKEETSEYHFEVERIYLRISLDKQG